ncbi:hypothetical protein DWZ82_13280, partial [Butyricicoccus sp. AF35-5AC]|uniref:hypothetical protein n=1 Tax=Butyricicoccus sp. AF35-5AC TaxID=2292003 RepID=UPI000FF3AA80
MIKKIQQDFSYYSHEFKDNYRKGVHRLRTILASRAQAQAFVSNAGGVAVVLGYEPETPDKNAQELYALLAASPYIENAVQTFLGSIYEAGAESQDAMYADSARCLEILHDPVMARAAGAGTVSAGKWIATLAGQSCAAYTDIAAVAASETAMTAVAASETAMAAVVSNATALNVVATSQAAMNAVAASETAMTAVIANTAAFNTVVTSHVAMNAVASSYVAVAAVYESAVAVETVKANETAWATLTGASSAVMGKAAAKLAGLNPADYADMTAIASSSAAMSAVAASQTAMAAIASSQTAMAAIASSQTAMAAVAASYVAVAAVYGSAVAVDAVKANETAWATLTGATSAVMGKAVAVLSGLNPDSYADMTAVASSSTAMTAIIGNSTALNAVVSSSTAMAAIEKSQVAKDAIAASDMATAKYAVGAAGLKPADYANMAAVAASQTAMAAIA